MDPQTRSSQRRRGPIHFCVPAPRGVPVTQWAGTGLAGTLEQGQSRQGLRWRWTRKGRMEEQGAARGGAMGWGGQRMREIQDGSCLLSLHPSSLCDISRWERVAGASPGCPDWPPAGRLLEWPFLLLTPMTSAARELLTGPSRHQVCMALSMSQSWAALPQLLHWPEHSSSVGHALGQLLPPQPLPLQNPSFFNPFLPQGE